MNAESARALGWELATHPDGLSEGLRERMAFGLSQTEAALTEAYDVFASTQQAFPESMAGLDVLVTPSAPGRGPGRTGMDRRSGIQFHLDIVACAVRDGAGGNRPERAAAGHPDRRPPRRRSRRSRLGSWVRAALV